MTECTEVQLWNKVDTLSHEIGKTPFKIIPDNLNRIYVKLEGENPSGSIKDRLALHLIKKALEQGQLKPGQPLVEVSTGNSGIALSRIANEIGCKAEIILPETTGEEVLTKIRQYNGHIVLASIDKGIEHFFELARTKAQQGYYWPNQYNNPESIFAYTPLGMELVNDAHSLDYLIAAIGTGGTAMGVGKYLREHNPSIKIIAVEPEETENISGLRNTNVIHRGSKDLYHKDFPNQTIRVSIPQAQEGLEILDKEGIKSSLSPGAALYAALKISKQCAGMHFAIIAADGKRGNK